MRRALLLGLALLAGAASSPAADSVDTRVFLIGDAGVPRPQDPVLASLAREVGRDPGRSLVVYLGDNIYPQGLPVATAAGRPEAERRLRAQVEAARAPGATVVFIPGNHDWDISAEDGWNAIRRQEAFLREAGGVELQPEGGCPGPVVRDVGARVRLVALDTQWWLHGGPRPIGPASPCAQKTEAEVAAALVAAVRAAGDRRVVVVGHHPLASGGPHGGGFGWKDHVFPLRAWKSWLWLPLPVIGSAYPIARTSGITDQDFSGDANRRMRAALEGAFAEAAPLVYAAGHEHNLQVVKRAAPTYLLVSGAGAHRHLTPTGRTDGALYARSTSGYMRLDVEASGGVRLSVVEVGHDGRVADGPSFDLVP